MRITNKIMQDNALYNINNNKVLEDKLSTQMSTNKKVTRPSDDPVVSIRALRLRTNVAEIDQYYEKNAPDAESWLKVTEDALSTTTEVLTHMIAEATKASKKEFSHENLDIVLQQMKLLCDEFYSTGNVDYAGQYVFTGYRTETTLTYAEDKNEQFRIVEQTTAGSMDTVEYVDTGSLVGLSDEAYKTIVNPTDMNDISSSPIHRLRLAYEKLEDDPVPKLTTADGTVLTALEVKSSADTPNPYQYVKENPDKAVFVPETGEILVGDEVYEDKFSTLRADTELRVTYDKTEWSKNDLRPEHYFSCTKNPDAADKVEYNKDYLNNPENRQVIEYDVGYNQTIRVNTTADEVYTHGAKRDMNDLESAAASLKDIETARNTLSRLMENAVEGSAEYNTLKTQYDAADKAYTYVRQNVQEMFEHMITKTQGYLADTNVAITENGTRSSRLDLISNRLMSQQSTFETLKSENEDIDIAEVVVKLTSAGLTYDAALRSTGMISQSSLINYI